MEGLSVRSTLTISNGIAFFNARVNGAKEKLYDYDTFPHFPSKLKIWILTFSLNVKSNKLNNLKNLLSLYKNLNK